MAKTPDRNPAHKELVDAIIDEELDAQALLRRVIEQGAKGAAATIMAAARALVEMRIRGRVSAEKAKELLREARKAALLAEFAQHAPALQEHVEQHHEARTRAKKKLGRAVSEIAPIRRPDVKARELERAGAVDDAGKLKKPGGGDA